MADIQDLVARWLPGAQFSERHSVPVQGDPAAIIAAIAALDDADDAVIRVMLQLREAPARLWDIIGGHSTLRGRPRFGLRDFTVLDRSDSHIVLGLVGRFWRLDFGLIRMTSPEMFRLFAQPGTPRLVMAYSVEQGPTGQRLVTETHVLCPDRRSRLMFLPYWCAIRLGSGTIRKRLLRLVRNKVQQSGQQILT